MTPNETNDKETEKKQAPVFCKSIRCYFREYCNYSSIHGFRYFGEKRTYFERGWWFIIFIIVVTVCAFQIRGVYLKWETSPVIVSFATTETPIYSIPFPAVTICPETKTRHSRYNHTDIIVKLFRKPTIPLNKTEEQNALYMSLICDFNSYFKKLTSGSLFFTNEFFDFLNATRRRNFIYDCKWMGDDVNCDDIFFPVITDEGICQTFNMLDRADMYKDNVQHFGNFLQNPGRINLTWNLDDGYSKNDKVETYPRRALFAGVKNALGLTLIAGTDDIDYSCKDLQGFRVILHTPMRIPLPSSQYFRVPFNQVVLGSIQPEMIRTTETVKVYNPSRRECYFPSERNLKYMKIYTQKNCALECLTNFTLSLCKCVNFYMPRENGTKICGAAKYKCMRNAEKLLQTKGLVTKLEELQQKSRNETDDNDDSSEIEVPVCDCMPICTDLNYNVVTSQADWQWIGKWKAIFRKTDYMKNTYQSKLMLYFKNSQFITSKRHELYGPTDFLANFGGLLGLFTGFSIFSLMEIIYFLTVRIFCNVRLYGAWYGLDPN